MWTCRHCASENQTFRAECAHCGKQRGSGPITSGRNLLDAAIEGIDSRSIREWAQSEHHGPVWLKIAERAVANGRTDVHAFTAYMICEAIGA